MQKVIHEIGHIIAILALTAVAIAAIKWVPDTYPLTLCILGIAGIAGYKIRNGVKTPPTPPPVH